MKNVLILGLALLAACAANAMPTLTGPTGGVEVPTADIAANGLTVAVDQALDVDGSAFPNSRLLFGIGHAFEFGGRYEKITQTDLFGSYNTETWNANAKLQFLHDDGLRVAIGGVYGQGLNNNHGSLHHQWNAYAVATMEFFGLKTSANFGYGKNFGTDTSGYNGGATAEFPMGTRTALGAEYLFGNKTGTYGDISSSMSHGNVYLTHAFTDNLSGRVAVGGLGRSPSVFLGASYRFGM